MAALTSETFASVLTSTVAGRPRASDPSFPAGEILTETIVCEDETATYQARRFREPEAQRGPRRRDPVIGMLIR